MDPIICRLPMDSDLIVTLNQLCAQRNLTRGSVSLIGAVQRAVLGYYRQDEQKYVSVELDEHLEIISGIGNISLKDGQPFVHLHLGLSREDCTMLGGHCMPGTIIYACEAILTPLPGRDLIRELDTPTGLPLWKEW
jgi:hypothetical protein